jgi:hypothetical protein
VLGKATIKVNIWLIKDVGVDGGVIGSSYAGGGGGGGCGGGGGGRDFGCVDGGGGRFGRSVY